MFIRGFPLHFQGKKTELPIFQGLLFSFSIVLVKIAVVWGTGGFSFFLLAQSYLDLRKGTGCGGSGGEGELPGSDTVLWRGPAEQSDSDKCCASLIVLSISLFGSYLPYTTTTTKTER